MVTCIRTSGHSTCIRTSEQGHSRVLFNVVESVWPAPKSLRLVSVKKPHQHRLGCCWHSLRQLDGLVKDETKELTVALCLERRLALEQLVQQHAKRPEVD